MVLGPAGLLKERFCARLAGRTRGTVLSVPALVRAAEQAIDLDKAIRDSRESIDCPDRLTPLQESLCRATTRAELDGHRQAMEAGKPADPVLYARYARRSARGALFLSGDLASAAHTQHEGAPVLTAALSRVGATKSSSTLAASSSPPRAASTPLSCCYALPSLHPPHPARTRAPSPRARGAVRTGSCTPPSAGAFLATARTRASGCAARGLASSTTLRRRGGSSPHSKARAGPPK